MSLIPRLVGMVHLLPLPGSPAFAGSIAQVVEAAVSDAKSLRDAGFPALLIENYGDVPFFASKVPLETVAAMTLATAAVREETGLPLGVNVLRNDAMAALAIAMVTGASLIRVNILTGMMYTDQGPIVGDAALLLRRRSELAPEVEIWADVLVKHATPPHGLEAGPAAADLVTRGLADAVIVSGSATGAELDLDEAQAIKDAVPEGTRIVAGSGVSVDNFSVMMDVADTVIVGTAVKLDQQAGNRVDKLHAAQLVEVARDHGLA